MYHSVRTKPGYHEPITPAEQATATLYQNDPKHLLELMDLYGTWAHHDAMDGLFHLASRNMVLRHQLELRLEAQVAPH
jgi:hypothetical protein